MKTVIITGSFDPVTVGHISVIKRVCDVYDKIYVVVLNNAEKEYMFSTSERKEILKSALKNEKKVVVDAYEGYTADYMHAHNITTIARGIRNENDKEYEKKLADIMKGYDPKFETVFFSSEKQYKDISSTKIREKILKNEDLVGYVPTDAIETIKKIISTRK